MDDYLTSIEVDQSAGVIDRTFDLKAPISETVGGYRRTVGEFIK